MDIDRIPEKASVFIDANIFIYHFAGVSEKCTRFLQRVREGEVVTTVSSIVVAEVIHRRMIAEAIDKGLVNTKNVVRKLKESPEMVKTLSQYSQDVEDILSLPIMVEPVTKEDIASSKLKRNNYGLLTNDSLNLACMERLKIADIVTHDNDFDNLHGLNIWKPDDI